MKILHVTKKYPNALGGDAVVVSNLEKQQKKMGDEVVILTSNCDEILDGKHIYKFGLKDTPAALDNITPKRLLSLIILFFKAFSIFRKERPDIIHTHSVDMAFFISFAARFYKIPIVHTFHIVTFNDPRHAGLRANIELKLLSGTKPTKIFILNPADIKDFNSAGFHNVVFKPNGVNVEDWQNTSQSKKDPVFTYIAVGRLEEQKGFSHLIEAAVLLKKEGFTFQIQIIGEGSQFQALEQLITKNNLTDQVILLGRKSPSELRKLYARANVFVLSSLWEGMPLSLLEAWAAGLPTIATKVSSVPYIAKDVSTLVSPVNNKELADAMRLLHSDKELRDTLAQRGTKSVHDTYQWSIIAKNLYEELTV